jgi:uracil-DNA glycosylase
MHKPLPPFGGWAGPRRPKMLIVGEAWGENERQCRQPFVGASGLLLWEMLGQAMPDIAPELHSKSTWEGYRLGNAWIGRRRNWLEEAGIAYTNVLNLQPPSNNLEDLCVAKKDLPHSYNYTSLAKGKYLRPEYLPELDRLLEEVDTSGPNCIVAAGNSACWALLHATNITAIRGTATLTATKPHTKVVPTYHPAAVLRQWQWRPITISDLMKAHRESEYPELIRPERFVTINPTIEDLERFVEAIKLHPPAMLSVDIETKGGQISCIGFATSSKSAMVVPFLNTFNPNTYGPHYPHYWNELDECRAWHVVKSLLESDVPKLFQNGLYDLQYIIKVGIFPKQVEHDTMLLHHSMYPEMRKGLGFLASIYSNEAAWKLMGRPKADTVKRDE